MISIRTSVTLQYQCVFDFDFAITMNDLSDDAYLVDSIRLMIEYFDRSTISETVVKTFVNDNKIYNRESLFASLNSV